MNVGKINRLSISRISSELIVVIFLCLIEFINGATTGKITGSVTDAETNEPLIGLNVIVENTGMGAASDVNGYYLIVNIPPGNYTLRFMMIGYRDLVVEDIDVRSDHTTTIDAQLYQIVLEAKEAVTVVATRPVIEMDRTSTESSVSGDQIEMMPVETVEDVLNLQAGVVDGHFRGGRSQEVVYQIDGVPINDAYSGNAALFIENDVIQELKVISGTFNAEYGQAQSGVVEIITKSGSSTLTGSASLVAGDYVSSRKKIFWNIDEITPGDYQDYTLYLSGPLGKKLKFLMSTRRVEDEGFLYGKNVFLPVDSVDFGDSTYIPMGFNDRTSFFGKLSLALTSYDRVSLSVSHQRIHQNRKSDAINNEIYDHLFRYNPLGQSSSYENANIGILNWNHILSPKSFFNLKASLNQKEYERYVYKDSLDSRYAVDWRLRFRGNYSFYTGGTDMSYITRSVNTVLLKGDITSQISRRQHIQLGVEYKTHQLKLHDITLKKNSETNFRVEVPPPKTADNQEYNRSPIEAAAYIQTKWESNDFIMNLGLRYDYFDAQGEIIKDLTRPRTSDRVASTPTSQLSPRIGIAYPITEKGVMHVSYGHFFQIPEFRYLYTNPSFTVNPEEGLASVFNYPFGNANLNSQKTIAYEIGLQQQLTYDISLDVTVYYKDIRNLLGTEINTIATGELHSGIQYGRYVNRDYGQVKGLTFMLEKKTTRGLGASVDYTYMVARGNASDPRSVLIDSQSDPPVESEKQLVALDWDQTHTLNTQVTFNSQAGYVVTIIGKIGSGMPYTPTIDETQAIIENSDRKPSRMTFDLFSMKNVKLGPVSLKLSFKVYNLFDRLNEKDVYGDSGRAGYTEELQRPGLVQGLNTKEDYFNRPDWYGSPRLILFGISTKF